jgi:hypothetical protein
LPQQIVPIALLDIAAIGRGHARDQG